MEGNGIIDMKFWRLCAAYAFVLVLFIIVKWSGISRERQIILATVRMTVQLILAGYVLTYIFKNPQPLLSLAFLCVMALFSIHNIFKQVPFTPNKKIKRMVILSMLSGPMAALFYFNLVVIHFTPWYEARYFIPIAGMIVGNAMTGVTLALKNLQADITDNRDKVEAMLILGATPARAIKSYVDAAFDSTVLPTLNNMLGMGIIFPSRYDDRTNHVRD